LTSDGITRFLTYHPTHATCTRAGHHFVQGNTLVDFPLPFYASITSCSDANVLLHSWTEQYVPATLSALFWENIRSMKNPSMWNNLRCDGDRTWIYNELCMGSLIVVHDGSYMREVSASISAAAVMILCTVTGSICTCTIAKHSASASSYRGEILGAIITQLILWAVVTGNKGPFLIMTEDCDNNGVVLHGNSPFCTLSSTQTQAHVLRIMK
jgi:hypothetical protein